LVEGNYLGFDLNYADLLGGKITLPSKDANNNYFTIVGTMMRNAAITDIYFLPDAKYEYYGDSCCTSMTNLKNVYTPTSMRVVGKASFAYCPRLEEVYLPETLTSIGFEAFYGQGSNAGSGLLGLRLDHLPTSVTRIGDRAFCMAGDRITIKEIPNSVTHIGTQAFMACGNVSVNHFGGENSALQQVGFQAFRSANTIAADVTEITINTGVVLKTGSDGVAYNTFGLGYPSVTSLRIGAGCENKYGDDTSALVADLFESTGRNITVSTLT
jgi:hypothetical protein